MNNEAFAEFISRRLRKAPFASGVLYRESIISWVDQFGCLFLRWSIQDSIEYAGMVTLSLSNQSSYTAPEDVYGLCERGTVSVVCDIPLIESQFTELFTSMAALSVMAAAERSKIKIETNP